MGSPKEIAKHVFVIVVVIVACAWVSRSTTFGKTLFGTGA